MLFVKEMDAMNYNQIAAWKDIQEGLGTESVQVQLIRVTLLTPAQERWLVEHKLGIADLLNGRYAIALEEHIHQNFCKPWNNELERNGLERCFSEDVIGLAMVDSIQKTLGMPIKFG